MLGGIAPQHEDMQEMWGNEKVEEQVEEGEKEELGIMRGGRGAKKEHYTEGNNAPPTQR